MVVDWGTLPNDMLELISKSLKSSFDLFQFRCVCSSWRNAAKPNKRLLPPHHDIPNHPDIDLRFHLSQRSILLIKPHYELAEGLIGGWLVKVEEHSHLPRKLSILHPLADYTMTHLFPPCSTRVLDMSKFKVRELGREFRLRCHKTVVKYLDDSDEDQSKFVLLTLNNSDNPGRLAVYTSWDQAWTVINDDMPCCYFCDVILFNGCFFAVTKDGTTVSVHLPSLKLKLAANPVFGGDKKFLIESSGEMLLVDMYLGMQLDSGDVWNFEEEDVQYHLHNIVDNEITDKITVFKLVEREKSWVEVKDLGDTILFLGDDSSFSASASDFLPLYGGCVFFHGFVFDWGDLNTITNEDFGVCEFMSQKMKLVRQHPEYAKLFGPPPSWITDRIPVRRSTQQSRESTCEYRSSQKRLRLDIDDA